MKVALGDLVVDPAIQLQSRDLDPVTVADYAAALESGATFPPVVVFRKGDTLWLAGGFHRYAAHQALGWVEIETEIRSGTREDALIYAATDNAVHGRPMSRAEKREAGERLLQLTSWSDRKIARRLAVHHETVGRWRDRLSCANATDSPATRTVTRGGTTYTMRTTHIGRSTAPAEVAASRTPLAPPLADRTGHAHPIKEDQVLDSAAPDEHRLAVHFSSASDEWLTPPHIIARVVQVLGAIDLDPCSNDHGAPNVPAARHFTAADDGLAQPWVGRVFMNSPYGRSIGRWVDKLVGEYEAGRVTQAIALLPARTQCR